MRVTSGGARGWGEGRKSGSRVSTVEMAVSNWKVVYVTAKGFSQLQPNITQLQSSYSRFKLDVTAFNRNIYRHCIKLNH